MSESQSVCIRAPKHHRRRCVPPVETKDMMQLWGWRRFISIMSFSIVPAWLRWPFCRRVLLHSYHQTGLRPHQLWCSLRTITGLTSKVLGMSWQRYHCITISKPHCALFRWQDTYTVHGQSWPTSAHKTLQAAQPPQSTLIFLASSASSGVKLLTTSGRVTLAKSKQQQWNHRKELPYLKAV